MENLIFLAHVMLLMVLSPILSRFFRIPTPVVEILLGSLAVWIGLLHVGNEVFRDLAKIGFFYLMFLAGLEIDIQRFLHYRDRFLKKALLYFFCLYAISFILYLFFNLSPVYIVAIPIVSLGMIMALINQHGREHRWLELSLIIGVIGELISIGALVIFDGAITHGLGWHFAKSILILIAVFFATYFLFQFLKIIFWWYPNLKRMIMPNNDTMQQSLRFSMALFFVLIATMQWLEIDMVLGAFLAGIFISNFFAHKKELPHQLSMFGFGFLVPLFFIFVGTTLDLNLVLTPHILIHALWIVLAMVGARMFSSFAAYYSYLGLKGTILFSLGDSMPLTFLVAIATIAVKNGAIGENEYASFIVAALMEGVLIMILIQVLMHLFKRYEQKNEGTQH
ncbi:cation:proton antiporter [Sulfurospirillum barnesii]|uniref:Kef-type K+ transport system, membrane component n=1 Tax=Sulfurospirillum barnesii (strain ATCC 700032 / DSM 10660 / SES-3) TaxID=760154 RepID=I3XWQ7_SULBS|nr:cation:proton antiporter [Sulfurospirillum barnesii]AFL68381.1 Kef-type K+ transport system, membrane component [Sulfurospirillum barnesii SES-3]